MELLDLQPEILFKIFSYLDSRFLVKNISLVCKVFHNYIHDDYMWKKRIISSALFNLLDLDTVNWKESSCFSEIESCRWKQNGHNMRKHTVRIEPSDTVFHIHLPKVILQDICICAGTPSNSLKFWNLQKLTKPGIFEERDVQVHVRQNSHKSWISAIKSSSSTLYTGSWDKTINVWDMENGCQLISSINCVDEVDSLCVHEHSVAACVKNRVKVFDIRSGHRPIQETAQHGSFIYQTYMDRKYIITSSDDNRIEVYDRLKNKILTELKCVNDVARISCDGELFMFGGDAKGAIYLWDMSKGKFEFIQMLDIGGKEPITGLLHTMGSLIVTQQSNDITFENTTTQKLQVFSLTFPLERWAIFSMETNSYFDLFCTIGLESKDVEQERCEYDLASRIDKKGVNISAPGIADLQLLGGKKRDVFNQMEKRGINVCAPAFAALTYETDEANSVVKRGANMSLPHLELGVLGGRKKRKDNLSGNRGIALDGLIGGLLGGNNKRAATTTSKDNAGRAPYMGDKKRSISDMAKCVGKEEPMLKIRNDTSKDKA
uniref:F-box domain-containing protein n=1 Tax=Strigamia maritima TaxID=126957 RepID=T1IJ60_STRMM